jgi:hypothetical protein
VISFFSKANPFRRVCLFDFERTLCDICNQHELISGCVTGIYNVLLELYHIVQGSAVTANFDLC